MRRLFVSGCPAAQAVFAGRRDVSATYGTTSDFEHIVMRYYIDGVESDAKADMRQVIAGNPVFQPPMANVSAPERDHMATVDQLRALAKSNLVSVSRARSTPTKYLALYDICGQLNGNLAVSAAAHYSMCFGIVSAFGNDEQRMTLEKANTIESLGTFAHSEVFASEAPLATSATYQPLSRSFVLQSGEGNGANKMPVINGLGADQAVVIADVVISNTNHGPHMFLVPLRDGRKLKKGISCKSIGRAGPADGLGSAVMRFDNVELPRSALFDSVNTITDMGEFVRNSEEASPLLPLITNQRLAHSSIAIGRCKRLLNDIVHVAASREVVGPFGELNHPVFAMQHVQNTVVKYLCELYAIISAHHRVTAAFADPTVVPEAESYVQLALVSSRATELMATLGELGHRLCGAQSAVTVSGFSEAVSLAALLREGTSDSHVQRLVAREVVANSYGTKSVSGYLKNKMSAGFIKRFVSNPFFSPTSMEIARYLILFTDREYAVRTALEQKIKIAQRNGAEDLFFAWNNEEHRATEHVTRAYTERFFVESLFEDIKVCSDSRNRRVLRDIAWQFSLCSIERDLPWLMREQMFAPRHISHLNLQLDNVSSNLAHQAVHLVDAFGIRPEMKTSPLGRDWEAHWAAQ